MQEENQAEEFLEITIRIIPWDEWIGAMETCFPKRKRGGVSMGIEKLLRMYSLQSWFNLPGPAKEDAIFGSCAIRKFTEMLIDFTQQRKFLCPILVQAFPIQKVGLIAMV